MALMQQRHFEFIARNIAPTYPWPTYILTLADELASTNPKFNRDKFIKVATKAWEDAHPVEDIDDSIPY